MATRSDLPAGTVTFLFTDVEGSTRLLHELGAEEYAEALAEHRRVIREACGAEGGVEVDTQGDAFFFAFPSASGAVFAAAAFTEGLVPGPIRVRVGLHTGEPLLGEEGYVGEDVHFAARVAATGHGGQVVLSAETAALVGDGLVSLGSHRLKDISEAVTIFQLGDGSFPPLKTVANSNLPTPASSFLGRERELYEADELLRGTRLLTVSGPGGAGKTRFALELARRAREERFADYADGVFSCFLASLRDPALVLPTMCEALSVAEQPGQSVLDALSSQFQGKRMLLLLDNAEHLLDVAPELARLLERSPGLTLLVTSRELLRIGGETTYPLPPLPDEEAVTLFCERAQVEPSEPIRELCARLEGLPLALELAAARVRVLTPEQLLERLSRRLDLLKAGRDTDPRQQTLRATVEWSYDLLTEEEQQLFARLSVFVGGCTLEAAEEVCDADLDGLQSLVDKSLLRFTEGRYWMLETIREFATERLDAGERETMSLRHGHFVLRLASEFEAASGSDAASRALTTEQDNVRRALAWAEASGQLELRLELIGRAWPFWWYRGHAGEGSQLVACALLACAGERTVRRAKVLAAASMFAFRGGELEAAARYAEESLELACELGDQGATVWPLILLGVCASATGDLDGSTRLAERAIATSHEVGDRGLAAVGLNNLGNTAMMRQDYASAVRLFEEALAISRELGTSDMVATETLNLAWCLHFLERSDEAADAARDGLLLACRVENFRSIPDGLVLVGALALRRGSAEAGARLVGAAGAVSDHVGDVPEDDTTLRLTIEELVRALGEDRYTAGVAEGRAMSLDQAVGYALASLD